jgi:hypothetical protein
MIHNIKSLKGITALTNGVILMMLLMFIVSCGGDDSSDGGEEPIPNAPSKATLIFPEANSECTEGSSKTATESTIQFKWNPGLHANSYKLDLKDLNTGVVTSYLSTGTSISLKLKRANPYSWSIISKSNLSTKTATSLVWKFFNAGEGVTSYVPFPAELVSPLIGAIVENTVVSLDWLGSDVDGDIESYDVYFGETDNPVKIETAITESILNTVPVVSGKKYYWKIDTKDEVGNVSESDLFNFSVN